MATIKSAAIQEFPEVKSKIVERVEFCTDADYYAIDIRFQDNTSLAFSFESCVVALPEYSDWSGGEQKPIKQYQPIRSATEARLKDS